MAHENQDMRTSFGFKRVDALEKQGLVNDVFSEVADRYDLMNDLMSGGLHRLWKADTINWLAPPRSERRYRLLDVAGGTGDIAKRFLDAAGPGASAIICDISPEMMRIGKTRVPGAVTFVQGTAEDLPFQNRSMDAYTIAFGIRNVPDIDRALREAYRVLTPGGRFLCLEFSEVAMPLLDRIYDAWSFKLIPEIGRLAAGSAEPYQYLVESIRQFPNQTEFSSHIEAAGFSRVRYRNLSGGIAAIHSAWRL